MATCETHGHLFDHSGHCIFCKAEQATATEAPPEAAFLKDGESVADGFSRNRRDIDALMTMLAAEKTAKETAIASRDTLKAAIEKMAEGMDRSGGDNYGMPECPWCHCQWEQEKDGSWPHAGDCELLLARFALAACVPPQETEK